MTNKLDALVGCVNAATDDALLMSRMNCHATNVSSIVVSEHNGCLLRAFLAWPGHRLSENRLGQSMPVGIHDHRYFLILRGLAGEIRNTCYQEAPLDKFGATILHKWAFESRLTNESSKVERLADRAVEVQTEEWLDWGSVSAMPHWQLHNIDCIGPAAWLVSESHLMPEKTTMLYTVADEVSLDGLYDKFESVEAVKQHVEQFVKSFH